MIRSSGVLLNVSSLPGEFGIGGFSKDCDRFIEEIAQMGFCWWQILPLTVAGAGDSPYSGLSAFAGNYLYIDPYETGLLTPQEIDGLKYHGENGIYLTDYAHARYAKKKLLELCVPRLSEEKLKAVEEFKQKHRDWLLDYALFMAIKDEFGGKPWYEWAEPLRERDKKALSEFEKNHREALLFYYFEQYEFFRQWERVKKVAHSYGIGIIGDIPIYVCHDSADVWSNRRIMQLDENGFPKKVAGVPPDYFSEDGQLWNNPLYDYKEMEKDDFKWFVARIIHNLEMYDVLRIDHMRGLYEYWAVPYGETTAKNGKWEKGPRMKLWNALRKKVKNPAIIAEDLGAEDVKVIEYVEETGFPGMRVLQFGFDGKPDNIHLPYNYPKNVVAYTGTHDNDTSLGWAYSLDDATRNRVMAFVNCVDNGGWGAGGGGCPITRAMIRSLMASSADLVVFPLQDLCGFGSDTRMNTPGVPEGNWRYRTNYAAISVIDRFFLAELNNLYGRNNNVIFD